MTRSNAEIETIAFVLTVVAGVAVIIWWIASSVLKRRGKWQLKDQLPKN